jgi:hypothetical protein
MATVPEQQSIKPSDYPQDIQKSVERLASPLNTFMSQAINAMNQNLTFGENFRGEVKQFAFTQANKVKTFKYSGSGRPTHVMITKLSKVPQTAITPYWDHDGKGNVTVTLIGDLNASGNTTVTLIIISE